MSWLLFVPCHRKPERCLHIKGKPMPLCARCTGILAGYLFLPIFSLLGWRIPLWIGIISQIPLLIDGYTQLRKWRMSNNALRLATGLISGFGLSVIIISCAFILADILKMIRQRKRREPLLLGSLYYSLRKILSHQPPKNKSRILDAVEDCLL